MTAGSWCQDGGNFVVLYSVTARSRLYPHGMTMTKSAWLPVIFSHDSGTEGTPGPPRTGSPPANVTLSGTQWPPTYGGSSHSRHRTRGRLEALGTARATRSTRRRNWLIACTASA